MSDSGAPDQQQIFEDVRPYLFAIAYRMLGSATDAEDVVQEAYLRLLDASPAEIASPKAYLATVVTRLCLDELKSARRTRERAAYPGNWLPEPVPMRDVVPSPDEALDMRESVSVAMLALLERLTPEQRAVYVLREAFDLDYSEIARVIGKSVAATRQLGRRGRVVIADGRPRFRTSPEEQRRLTERFLETVSTGDLPSLIEMLAADVVFWGDGGPKVAARRRPIAGKVEVGRFLGALMKLAPPDLRATIEEINSGPAVVTWIGASIVQVIALDPDPDGRLAGIRIVINPDKLIYLQRRLGPPGSEPYLWSPRDRSGR